MIEGYYINEENKFKNCHPNCLKCINAENKNCLKCKPNLYLTENTNSCLNYPLDNYYLDHDKNILRQCHPNCKKCLSSPKNKTHMNCIICQSNLYLTFDTNSCLDYIPDHYYLDDYNILRYCHKKCFNCFGAWDNETMNCSNCINNNFFYKNDTNNCILKDEFKKRNNLEFQMIDNNNFYIFIFIFVVSIITFILICIFYKIKEQDNSINKNLNKLPLNQNTEMEEIKSNYCIN